MSVGQALSLETRPASEATTNKRVVFSGRRRRPLVEENNNTNTNNNTNCLCCRQSSLAYMHHTLSQIAQNKRAQLIISWPSLQSVLCTTYRFATYLICVQKTNKAEKNTAQRCSTNASSQKWIEEARHKAEAVAGTEHPRVKLGLTRTQASQPLPPAAAQKRPSVAWQHRNSIITQLRDVRVLRNYTPPCPPPPSPFPT